MTGRPRGVPGGGSWLQGRLRWRVSGEGRGGKPEMFIGVEKMTGATSEDDFFLLGELRRGLGSGIENVGTLVRQKGNFQGYRIFPKLGETAGMARREQSGPCPFVGP